VLNPDDDRLDQAAIAAGYASRVAALAGGRIPDALVLRDRLDPERWVLEWHLPWWAGRAFGLDPSTCAELCLGNVLGVAALRLRDDAADGELTGPAAKEAIDLADRLWEAALDPYRDRLGPDSPFWDALAATLAEGRGAPLKASALAVCLLADRQDAYPVLGRCIDHALRALVLFDHAADWEADLLAGRPNELVSHIGAGGERADVLVALMARDPLPAYLARVQRELAAAVELSDRLAIGALSKHLRKMARDMAAGGLAMREHYVALRDRAAALFMQEEADDRSTGR
jgi:hypothetical protein